MMDLPMALFDQAAPQVADQTTEQVRPAAGYFSAWQQPECYPQLIEQQRLQLQQQLASIEAPADLLTQLLTQPYPEQPPSDPVEPFQLLSPATQQQVLQLYLPFLSLQPGWLSPALVITQAYRAWGASLIRLFETIWQSPLPLQIRAVISQGCQQYQWPEPTKPSYPLQNQSPEIAYDLANLLFTLGHHPATFRAEIPGACWALLHANYLCSPVRLFPPELVQACRQILSDMLQNTETTAADSIGFGRGYLYTKTKLQQWQQQIGELTGPTTPHQQMLQLLEKFGSSPCGYHKKGSLAGQPLDNWFQPELFDSNRLLQALAQSPYIKAGQPDRSRLINQLIAADGPMFRIFSPADQQVLQQWIASLPSPPATAQPIAGCPHASTVSRPTTPQQVSPQQPAGSLSSALPQLYHQLLDPEQFPQVKPAALQYCQQWLNAHQVALHLGDAPLPFPHYQHALFKEWVEQQHLLQVQSYRPLVGQPELCVNELKRQVVQLLPFVMIDGAWLRGFTQPKWLHCDIGRLLLRTYLDELGNGHLALHHGNIYRQLVESMGFSIADFTTAEFVQLDLFSEEDFAVPVFWLAISLFPNRFFAELLGLNLAMELSGIGGDYRRAGDMLRFYGFSSQFNELHNSIDNIVTGHTGWALQAIQLFMDQYSSSPLQDLYWQRIWTGYRALKPPSQTRRFISQSRFLSRLLSKKQGTLWTHI